MKKKKHDQFYIARGAKTRTLITLHKEKNHQPSKGKAEQRRRGIKS